MRVLQTTMKFEGIVDEYIFVDIPGYGIIPLNRIPSRFELVKFCNKLFTNKKIGKGVLTSAEIHIKKHALTIKEWDI